MVEHVRTCFSIADTRIMWERLRQMQRGTVYSTVAAQNRGSLLNRSINDDNPADTRLHASVSVIYIAWGNLHAIRLKEKELYFAQKPLSAYLPFFSDKGRNHKRMLAWFIILIFWLIDNLYKHYGFFFLNSIE